MITSLLLLGVISAAKMKLIVLVCIGLVAWLVVDKGLTFKHYIDTVQYKASRAGGVALEIGFKTFDELLFWIGAGNIKESRKILEELFKKYCQSDRGPVQLARDVFMATWAKLRVDKEFGNECRQEVVHEALGIDINDKMDVTMAKASERLEKIGWTKLGHAAEHMAAREWTDFAADLKSCFDEVMEPDGEKKIALRVMEPTLQVLWDDPKYHDQAAALVQKFSEKLVTKP